MTGAIIGAKVFQLVGYIIRDGSNAAFWTIQNWKSLLLGIGIFYGGLIGGFLAVLIYIWKSKLDFRSITDILVPSVLLFHAFGRLGCFFAGCCCGRESTWGITIHGDVGRGIFLLSTSQWISLLVFPAGIILLRWVIKTQSCFDSEKDMTIQ